MTPNTTQPTQESYTEAFSEGYEMGRREYTRLVDERRDDVTEVIENPDEREEWEIDALQRGFTLAREEWEPGVDVGVDAKASDAYAGWREDQ